MQTIQQIFIFGGLKMRFFSSAETDVFGDT